MKLKIIDIYEVPKTPKYGYSQFIAMKNGWGFGLCKNSIDNEYYIQIFKENNVQHIAIPPELFGKHLSNGQVFTVKGRMCILAEGKNIVLFNSNHTKFEVIKIKNFEKVLINPETNSETLMIPAKYLGKTDSNKILVSYDYTSDGDHKYIAKLKIDTENRKAEWFPIGFKKTSFLRKKYFYYRMLKPSEFPLGRHPKFFKYVIVYNTLIKGEINYIFSIGKRLVKSAGQSFSSLSILKNTLNLEKHLFIEDHDSLGNLKFYGKSGIFTTSTNYCIITPEYIKEDSWGGKQKIYSIATNEIVNIIKPKGFSTYKLIDENDGYFWLENWDKELKTKYLVKCNEV